MVVADAGYTVEELAKRVGMTVRNLREYQRLGLLTAPVKRGRVGYYDEAHVERIARVQELRARGFSLQLIGRLLDEGDEQVMALARTAAASFHEEAPEPITREEYIDRFNITSHASIARAVAGGLLRELEDERLEIRSPRLARVGDAMVRLGLTLDDMLALLEQVRSHQDAVADLFMQVFKDRVWTPFEAAGSPPEGVPLVTELLELVRPRALDTVAVAFAMAMDAKAAEVFAALEEDDA